MKLSLTRKLSSSEKMTIGSESSKNLRTSFKRMVYESRKNYSKVKKSSSFRQLLREQKEYISNSSLDNFIEGGRGGQRFQLRGENDLSGAQIVSMGRLCVNIITTGTSDGDNDSLSDTEAATYGSKIEEATVSAF